MSKAPRTTSDQATQERLATAASEARKPRDAPSPKSEAKPDQATPPPDQVDIASMDSFPCSDPPGYYAIRL